MLGTIAVKGADGPNPPSSRPAGQRSGSAGAERAVREAPMRACLDLPFYLAGGSPPCGESFQHPCASYAALGWSGIDERRWALRAVQRP